MRVPRASRYQGKITAWKDEQGFGFIAPNGGGPAVFAHIKSFSSRYERPAIGRTVTYRLTVNERGQPRAEDVAFYRARAAREASADTGASAPFIGAGFLALTALAALTRKLPPLVFGLYFALSAITFLAYWIDKCAARNNRLRTPENTLHLLAMLGGWPGALVAQRVLRHKSRKAAFRAVFWWTLVFNCVAFAWLLSPAGAMSRGLLDSALSWVTQRALFS